MKKAVFVVLAVVMVLSMALVIDLEDDVVLSRPFEGMGRGFESRGNAVTEGPLPLLSGGREVGEGHRLSRTGCLRRIRKRDIVLFTRYHRATKCQYYQYFFHNRYLHLSNGYLYLS